MALAKNGPQRFSLRKVFRGLGPGLITGASDDDPSGIGTYAVAGASLGYATLWVALFTFPLMATVQFICAKVGMVSGRGLAGVLREHYPRWLVYTVVFLLLVANVINAGVDLGAIAAGVHLLVPLHEHLLVIVAAAVLLCLQIWGSYQAIVRIFKWLTLALFAYIGAAFLARPEWRQVLFGTLVPTIQWNAAYAATLVAILGTTISPYLFFWQSSHEVEERKAAGRCRLWQRRGATDEELRYAAWDVNTGMFFSNVVMYFIILATAATLHQAGQTEIGSAVEAAEALRPLAGSAATLLMALGLIGSGALAVPILIASAAYALSETFRWRHGLDEKLRHARAFYLVIIAATTVAVLINFLAINPFDALFWTAVINGLLAPPLLVVILLVANNRAIMGRQVNPRWMNTVGWFTTGLMFAAAAGLFLTWGQ